MMTKDDKESLTRIIGVLKSVFAYRGQFERDLGDYQMEKLKLGKNALDQLIRDIEADDAEFV